MLTVAITTLVIGGLIWAYQVTKPPPSKICGSQGGPPVTSPRIKLRDGRYLAYKERGAVRKTAKYKVILTHGFCATKETYIPLSDKWLEELGICLITFDRPGYSESDPNPLRTPKSDAFDIQELADQLELGPKIYLIGLSMGTYPVWGCLKYIPHRLAGVTFIGPLINNLWPSLPNYIKALTNRSPIEKLIFMLLNYAPRIMWILARKFPTPTLDVKLKRSPQDFNDFDREVANNLAKLLASDQDKIEQQGRYESVFRDIRVAFGDWGFDPLELTNPFVDNQGSVHLWIGQEDRFVPVEAQRYIATRLSWMRRHEVPKAGHLYIHDANACQKIFRSLVLDEDPTFD